MEAHMEAIFNDFAYNCYKWRHRYMEYTPH